MDQNGLTRSKATLIKTGGTKLVTLACTIPHLPASCIHAILAQDEPHPVDGPSENLT